MTLDEFIQGCLKDEYLSQLLKSTFLSNTLHINKNAINETNLKAI